MFQHHVLIFRDALQLVFAAHMCSNTGAAIPGIVGVALTGYVTIVTTELEYLVLSLPCGYVSDIV